MDPYAIKALIADVEYELEENGPNVDFEADLEFLRHELERWERRGGFKV